MRSFVHDIKQLGADKIVLRWDGHLGVNKDIHKWDNTWFKDRVSILIVGYHAASGPMF